MFLFKAKSTNHSFTHPKTTDLIVRTQGAEKAANDPEKEVMGLINDVIDNFGTMVALPEASAANAGVAISAVSTLGMEISSAIQDGSSDVSYPAFIAGIIASAVNGSSQCHSFFTRQVRIQDAQLCIIRSMDMRFINECSSVQKNKESVVLQKPYDAEKIIKFMQEQGHIFIDLAGEESSIIFINNDLFSLRNALVSLLAAIPLITTLVTNITKILDPEFTLFDHPGARASSAVAVATPALTFFDRVSEVASKQELNVLKAYRATLKRVYIQEKGLHTAPAPFIELLAKFVKADVMESFREKMVNAKDVEIGKLNDQLHARPRNKLI